MRISLPPAKPPKKWAKAMLRLNKNFHGIPPLCRSLLKSMIAMSFLPAFCIVTRRISIFIEFLIPIHENI